MKKITTGPIYSKALKLAASVCALVAMLEEWTGTLPGVFLYYPSRRQPPVPLRVFLDFIKKWRKRPVGR